MIYQIIANILRTHLSLRNEHRLRVNKMSSQKGNYMKHLFTILLISCLSLHAEKKEQRNVPIQKKKSVFSIKKEKASTLVLEKIKKDIKNKKSKIELVRIDFAENLKPQYVYHKSKKNYDEWIITYKIGDKNYTFLVDLKKKSVEKHEEKKAYFIKTKNKN